MSARLTAAQVLEREFLEVRCRFLDIAASLDRLNQATGAEATRADPRIGQMRDAAGVLADDKPDRLTRVHMLFSLPYEQEWRSA